MSPPSSRSTTMNMSSSSWKEYLRARGTWHSPAGRPSHAPATSDQPHTRALDPGLCPLDTPSEGDGDDGDDVVTVVMVTVMVVTVMTGWVMVGCSGGDGDVVTGMVVRPCVRACAWGHLTAAGPGDAVEGGRVGVGAWGRRGSPGRSPPRFTRKTCLYLLQDLQLPEHVADSVPLGALLLAHVLCGVHLLRVPFLHDAHLGGGGRCQHRLASAA